MLSNDFWQHAGFLITSVFTQPEWKLEKHIVMTYSGIFFEDPAMKKGAMKLNSIEVHAFCCHWNCFFIHFLSFFSLSLLFSVWQGVESISKTSKKCGHFNLFLCERTPSVCTWSDACWAGWDCRRPCRRCCRSGPRHLHTQPGTDCLHVNCLGMRRNDSTVTWYRIPGPCPMHRAQNYVWKKKIVRTYEYIGYA